MSIWVSCALLYRSSSGACSRTYEGGTHVLGLQSESFLDRLENVGLAVQFAGDYIDLQTQVNGDTVGEDSAYHSVLPVFERADHTEVFVTELQVLNLRGSRWTGSFSGSQNI